jgi:hypothetical protein
MIQDVVMDWEMRRSREELGVTAKDSYARLAKLANSNKRAQFDYYTREKRSYDAIIA